MNHAVGDAPGFRRVGVVVHAKGETVKIRAVEKLDATGRRDDILRRGNFRQCKGEEKKKPKFHN
jgi:hypothetical protein